MWACKAAGTAQNACPAILNSATWKECCSKLKCFCARAGARLCTKYSACQQQGEWTTGSSRNAEVVSCFKYAAQHTRQDLVRSVDFLSRFKAAPKGQQ